MELTSVDVQHKRFRAVWMGYDKRQVEAFLQQIAEDIQHVKLENANLQKDLQNQEKELKEYKEREKTIRNVLLNVHKTVEQMKATAEKESKLIVAEAELKADKILQGAHQRLARLHADISELKRQRIQLETKLRSTIETYRQLLDMDRKDLEEDDPESRIQPHDR